MNNLLCCLLLHKKNVPFQAAQDHLKSVKGFPQCHDYCERNFILIHGKAMSFFFFNDTATTEIYTLSLHDALPICVFFFHGLRTAVAEATVDLAGSFR